MKQDHQTSFGRQISAVPIKSARVVDEENLLDKWQLLSALTDAATDFGLTHRSLSVLRALISFHPDRMISTARHSCIVFPANRTLSERLGGMPESTLRRHLVTLVSAGIVSRHDSANRKRFARRCGAGDARIAFGFDLSPMARLAPQIIAASEVASNRRMHLQSLRAEVASLRQRLIDTQGPSDLTDDTFKLLRRKPDEATLVAALDHLDVQLHASEMSDADAQNERHIQPEIKTYSEKPTSLKKSGPTDTPSFEDVVSHCSEYQSFFPEPPQNWQDLSRCAYALCPMIGIDLPLYGRATQQMGAKRAITSVLCILENIGRIHNPAGYLQRLIQRHVSGGIDFDYLLKRCTTAPEA
ncbi:plasmid replication protein RepC [uncultured Sulfitobacter sp.]|uniref:plasmid replication protein RepC n=1 Tax=uncultured Sulfitobacter sp. TaxID=191468 RepID=UPI002605288B|nr:plasmid replication protein RepC [uncultured Sulfitobacter sp.]